MVDISRWTSSMDMPPARTKRRAAESFSFTRKPLALQRDLSELSVTKMDRSRANAMGQAETIQTELLTRLMLRGMDNLTRSTSAQSFLKDNGITDERTWSAFRIGTGDPEILSSLADAERERLKSMKLITWNNRLALAGSGAFLPTFDPRSPENVTGFIRLCPAQNKHHFATTPLGLACGPDIDSAKRVVLVDSPWLAFRLAQVGAKNVAIVESPEVLMPLKDWMASKTLVLASYRNDGLDAMKAALGTLAANVTTLLFMPDLRRSPPTSLEALGIDPDGFATPEAPPITAQLLKRLMEYARQRMECGEGAQALKSIGADHAEFVRAYGLGYLPPNYGLAMPVEDRRSLAGQDIGGCILAPAFDGNGAITDLIAIHPDHDSSYTTSVMAEVSGLVAPRIATSFEQIVVTDSIKLAAGLFRAGRLNTLFLRGPVDARLNAQRLWDSGVREATVMAHRSGDEIAGVLSSMGMVVKRAKWRAEFSDALIALDAATTVANVEGMPSVEASSVPVLAKHDPKTERATFKAGDATYTIETDLSNGTKLEVRLERENKIHIDRFDLAVEAQRVRFATSGAMRTQIPFEDISAHLIALLDGVRALHDRQINPESAKPVVAMSDTDRHEAITLLKRTDLLDTIATDLESLGWVGEDASKRLLYMIAISRKLSAPLAAVLMASSGAGKSKGLETISELVPPEDLIHVSRLTDSALYYHGADALRHKLLTIDEFDALTQEVIVALRVLQSRGALSQSHTQRDAFGKTTINFSESHGPVAVLTSSAGKVEEQLLSRCIEVPVDESSAQTSRIVKAHLARQLDADFGGSQGKHGRIIQRHRTLQRLLECRAVMIPFADRIEFPSSHVKHRRALEKVLGLVQASALLHQYQRLKQKNSSGEEIVIATERDFEIAVALAAEFVARSTDELSRNARDVLELIRTAKLDQFDVNDLKNRRPEWTRHVFRSGLDELLALEIILSPKRARPRSYTLNAAAALSAGTAGIRLRPEGAPLGDLATFGETAFANTSRNRAIG